MHPKVENRIYVATRKGLVEINRSDAGWSVGRCHFLAEPVTAFLVDSRDQSLYAALKLGHFGVKLHRSDDGGESWQELASPAYPEVEESETDCMTLLEMQTGFWSFHGAPSCDPIFSDGFETGDPSEWSSFSG